MIRFIVFCFIVFVNSLSVMHPIRCQSLDSLNSVRCVDKGVFTLYITRAKLEVLSGLIRDRINDQQQTFKPLGFTYNIFLPFQLDLNHLNKKAKDKLMKINMSTFIHHSVQGNYGLGLGVRFGFLIIKNIYISFQTGIGWFEVTNESALDGLTNKGFNFLHMLSLSYEISKNWAVLIGLTHVSNGGILGEETNVQDGLGLGVSYKFEYLREK